jgi:hypothetical protein
MRMKAKLNMTKIARGLGAQRRGTMTAGGGYFGAMQLAAEVRERFQTPPRGGRATDPSWTERRLVPLASNTLRKLEHLATKLQANQGVSIEPLQLAGLLLEDATHRVAEGTLGELARGHDKRRRSG